MKRESNLTCNFDDAVEHRDIPALDGLRAVAVGAVIVVHVAAVVLRGGFMGVDVFFVLSGFLITSIIHKDCVAGRFSFREFYLRRVQRLLPNATLTVLATVLFLLIMRPFGLENTAGAHGIWTLLNFSNIFAWNNFGGYWDVAAELSPLTHFWSLGIEEQFYMVFPLAFFLLFRYAKKEIVVSFIFSGIAVVSFCCCLWMTYQNSSAAFFIPVFRIWELTVGAILALRVKPFIGNLRMKEGTGREGAQRSVLGSVCGMFGMTIIVCSYIVFSKQDAFPGWVALFPVVGTLLSLFSIVKGTGILPRVLSFRPLVLIGKYSYSLYLWHWPAIILTKMSLSHLDWKISATLGGVFGIILGIVAYYLVERPLRRRGAGRGKRLCVIAVLFGVTLAVCVVAKYNNPEKDSFAPTYATYGLYEKTLKGASQPVILEGENATVKWELGERAHQRSLRILHFLSEKAADLRNEFADGFVKRFGVDNSVPVLVFGDSQAETYSLLLEQMCKVRKWNVFYSLMHGVRMFYDDDVNGIDLRPECIEDSKKRVEQFGDIVKKWKPEIIFMAEYWSSYPPDYLEWRLDSFLANIPRSTKVIIPMVIPFPSINCSEDIRCIVRKNPVLHEVEYYKKRGVAINQGFSRLEKKYPNLSVIHVRDVLLNADGTLNYISGNKLYYADFAHLSMDGAELLRPLFEVAFNKSSIRFCDEKSLITASN